MIRAHRFTMSEGNLCLFGVCRGPFLVIALALTAGVASAQVSTGTPPFGSFGGGPDVINLANLNSQITIPVLHKPGRGIAFTYDLSYDTSVWYPVTSGGTTSWQSVANFGWRGQTEVATGFLSYNVRTITCTCFYDHGVCIPQGQTITYSNFAYHDAFGVTHPFPGSTQSKWGTCGSQNPSLTSTATDGSGYTLQFPSSTITSRSGTVINPPVNNSAGAATATDRNGNQISVSSSGVFTDTLSAAALTVAGTAPNPTTFTYTAPSGASASFTMSYKTYTVKTNFGASGINEYGPTSVSLVDNITLPDGSKYSFTYEQTPSTPASGACTPLSGTYPNYCVTGRIASVTLPTGGQISYSYTGGTNGIFTDGSASGLTRTTPDGAWTYARTAGTGAAYTTTVTDPQGNQAVIQFQGIYETQRQIYQGLSTSGTLLQTTNTCYNGNLTNCNSTAITLPITQRNITTVLPGGLQSEHDDFWNTYGMPTEVDEYDYGAGPHGPLLKKILATYAALGNINAFRQSVTVQNGQGQTVSQVNYNYDETAVVTTSGTPQLVAVTGVRGNLTSVNNFVNATTFLTESFTYFDTGNAQTSKDVNGAVTTYVYSSTGSCGNSFPTSLSLPLGLTRSMAWNCTGGVQTSSTDENGNATTTAYTDPYFWRPASVTDPTSTVTNTTYLSTTQTETSLTFNGGGSTVDTVVTLDGLGRPLLNQVKQAPGSSNFDSTETDYDSLGRVSHVTLPYVGTLGQTNLTAPGNTTSYDALGRQLSVSDSGGGSATYSYVQNDVLVTSGPAPMGENTKKRQMEYDALGRLTSVCEVTTAAGSGTCGQTVPQTGYWTKYSYDAQGNLTAVAQNAQASGSTQARTYTYDQMSRLTSENNPESGITSYVYDTDAACGTSNGNLVKRTDAAGNVTCSTFDALRRQLSATYPSGPNASLTPNKYFVYDSATVNGVAMANAKNRRAEAYTCFSPCTSKLTDLGFSYTTRGRISDAYESTPNSAGYYHASAIYWENGATRQLTGLSSLPTITYGPDGEGRLNTVSASSGQNPVSGTAYNAASLPTAINLGSGAGDADSFTYDSNTNRMT